MNPYASFLGTRDPMEIVRETSGKLAGATRALGPAVEWRPAPGKWNTREILCHLADNEIAFAFRLRQALAEHHLIIQPYDQEKWAVTYQRYSADAALNAFTGLRAWNVALVQPMSAADLAKGATHPELGEMTIREIVEMMAGHDLNHLQQLDAIVASCEARRGQEKTIFDRRADAP